MTPGRTTPSVGATTAPSAGASVATDLRAASAVRSNVRGPIGGSAPHAVGLCACSHRMHRGATALLLTAGRW